MKLSVKEFEALVKETIIDVVNDMLFESIVPKGPLKKTLRKVNGTLKIVKKRKKPVPLSMRTITKAAARRRGRKSAIKRKAIQRKVTKKAVKTTRKGRARGLYKGGSR
ncbi:hypothetical protein HN803_03805 [candidate division WWE3 bacterium]|nr:hypothetical protein [candidate division WWE3 bacterium]